MQTDGDGSVSTAKRTAEKTHTYAFIPKPGAIPTGRFARAPMRTEARAETAAVVVIKS